MSQNCYPQWQPPVSNPGPTFLKPAVSDSSFYSRPLEDDEIPALAEQCSDDDLQRLINDASEVAQINALRVIAVKKNVSEHTLNLIYILMKSTSPALAAAAFKTLCALQVDSTQLIENMTEAMIHTESDEVRRQLMETLQGDHNATWALIHAFYVAPRKYAMFILKMLKSSPAEDVVSEILKGLDRSQSVECIGTTIESLLHAHTRCDSPKMREILIDLIKRPISYENYGLMSRLNSIKILKEYVAGDNPVNKDQSLVASLTNIYQNVKNNELKGEIKELLKFMGEAANLDVDEDEIYD